MKQRSLKILQLLGGFVLVLLGGWMMWGTDLHMPVLTYIPIVSKIVTVLGLLAFIIGWGLLIEYPRGLGKIWIGLGLILLFFGIWLAFGTPWKIMGIVLGIVGLFLITPDPPPKEESPES